MGREGFQGGPGGRTGCWPHVYRPCGCGKTLVPSGPLFPHLLRSLTPRTSGQRGVKGTVAGITIIVIAVVFPNSILGSRKWGCPSSVLGCAPLCPRQASHAKSWPLSPLPSWAECQLRWRVAGAGVCWEASPLHRRRRATIRFPTKSFELVPTQQPRRLPTWAL